MAKGEIARFEQFLLLSLCFKKPSAAVASESVYMRKRVNFVISVSEIYFFAWRIIYKSLK